MDDLKAIIITQGEEAARMANYYLERIQQLEAERDAAYAKGVEDAAKVAIFEGCAQHRKKRKTKNFGLPREAYPHEVANDIAAAIRKLTGE